MPITYANKTQATTPSVPVTEQWRAVDANEVKTVVNALETALGATVIIGSGPPQSANGLNGQYWMDQADGKIFGPKTAGAWNLSTFFYVRRLGNSANALVEVSDQGQTVNIRAAGAVTIGDELGVNQFAFIGSSDSFAFLNQGSGLTVLAVVTTENNEQIIVTAPDATVSGPNQATHLIARNSGGKLLSYPLPSPSSGNTILNGTVDPGAGTGNNGDFYINTSTLKIFGPKASGAWTFGVDMLGADGAPGQNGEGVLAGGTTKQVLRKASNTDFDMEWATVTMFDGTGLVNGDIMIYYSLDQTFKRDPKSTVNATTGDVGSINLNAKTGSAYGEPDPHTVNTVTISTTLATDGFATLRIQTAAEPTWAYAGLSPTIRKVGMSAWSASGVNKVLLQCINTATPVIEIIHLGVEA